MTNQTNCLQCTIYALCMWSALVPCLHWARIIHAPYTPLCRSSRNSSTALRISDSVRSSRDTTLKLSCRSRLVRSYTSTMGALSCGWFWYDRFPINKATLSVAIGTKTKTPVRFISYVSQQLCVKSHSSLPKPVTWSLYFHQWGMQEVQTETWASGGENHMCGRGIDILAETRSWPVSTAAQSNALSVQKPQHQWPPWICSARRLSTNGAIQTSYFLVVGFGFFHNLPKGFSAIRYLVLS